MAPSARFCSIRIRAASGSRGDARRVCRERSFVLRARSRVDGAPVRRLVARRRGRGRQGGRRRRLQPAGPVGVSDRRIGARVSAAPAPTGGDVHLGRSNAGRKSAPSRRRRERFASCRSAADGKTAAVERRDAQGVASVWLIDLERGSSTRVPAEYWAGEPLWSFDDRDLSYSIASDSPPNLVVRSDRGAGAERRLTKSADIQYATSWTPDGRTIVFQAFSNDTGWNLFTDSRGGRAGAAAAPDAGERNRRAPVARRAMVQLHLRRIRARRGVSRAGFPKPTAARSCRPAAERGRCGAATAGNCSSSALMAG